MDASVPADGEFDYMYGAYLYVPSSDTVVLDLAVVNPLPPPAESFSPAEWPGTILGRSSEWEELSVATQWALVDILCRLYPFARAAELLGLDQGRVYEFIVLYHVEMCLWYANARTCVPEPLSSHEAAEAKSFLRARGLDFVTGADVDGRVAAAPAADAVPSFAELPIVTFCACDADGSFPRPPGFEWLDFVKLQIDIWERFGRITREGTFENIWVVPDCEMDDDESLPSSPCYAGAIASDFDAFPDDGRDNTGAGADVGAWAWADFLVSPTPASAAAVRPSTGRNAEELATPPYSPEPSSSPDMPSPPDVPEPSSPQPAAKRRKTAEAEGAPAAPAPAAAAALEAATHHAHSAAEADFAAIATRASFAVRARRLIDPPATLARRCRRAARNPMLPQWPAEAAARMELLRAQFAAADAEGPAVRDVARATLAGWADWAMYALSADEAYHALDVSGGPQGGQ